MAIYQRPILMLLCISDSAVAFTRRQVSNLTFYFIVPMPLWFALKSNLRQT
jgi:hypothetical protein